MNVVVMIKGREAIPVRAIPLLTDWETMDSGVIADVLAWDKAYKGFPGLHAFHIDDSVHPIKARWWKNLVCQQMKALNESIKAVEVSDETGLQEWRYRSLEILPAGVFVWKDEFEPLYERRYGPDGESVVSPSGVLPEDEHAECVALNFRPHISDPAIRELVMKGFECLRGTSVAISPCPNDKHVTHSAAAPVVADGDGLVPLTTAPATDTVPAAPVVACNGKKWTFEKLAELKAYREGHTMPETAARFGISEQRIRGLLPTEKPKAKPFARLIHRMK